MIGFCQVFCVDLRRRVEEAARRAGITSQRKLASACGVSQPWVAQVLAGEGQGHDLLRKISELTSVSVDWLRDGRPHDAPEWARDYADPDIEALEQLRTHLVMHVPRENQERLIPRDPSAADLVRWLDTGRATGWRGDSRACWRGWLRATSQLEETEIIERVHASAEVVRLRQELADARDALASLAVKITKKPVSKSKHKAALTKVESLESPGAQALREAMSQPLPTLRVAENAEEIHPREETVEVYRP